MLRNVAGQAIGSQVLNLTTGQAFTGVVTVYVTGDGGTQGIGVVGGGLATAEGNGYYTYTPSQPETNYHLVAFTFVGVGAIPATVQVATITEAQQAAIASATITIAIGDGPTRTELLNQLAHRLNKTPPPNMDSSTETRLVSYLNQRQRRLLTLPGMRRLRDATVTFTSVPDQADYGLPNIAKISRIFETTNERTLFEMSIQDYRLVTPVPISGTPEAYVWRGRQVVALQPFDPSSLWVVSSHPNDTAVLVYVEGVLSGNVPRATTVTLNGIDPVNITPAVVTWERVDKLYLAAPTLGSVSMIEFADPPATMTDRTLAVIPAGHLTAVYTGLTLYPTPSDALPYHVDITRTVTDLTHGTDQAAIPEDFSDVLVLGALADEYQHLSDSRWQLVMTEYKERENQLKYWLAETAIGRPYGLAQTYQRPSQLGAWYPAGS